MVPTHAQVKSLLTLSVNDTITFLQEGSIELVYLATNKLYMDDISLVLKDESVTREKVSQSLSFALNPTIELECNSLKTTQLQQAKQQALEEAMRRRQSSICR
jgi:hypothetical protein